MLTKTSVFALALAYSQYGIAASTWPASIDELEDILFLNSGYRARGFATPVSPCSKGITAGRTSSAEWIRTAFHDSISGNVYTGVGGLDGSIQFELASSENNGNAFPGSVAAWAPFLSNRTSLADIVAAAVYTATRSCGGPIVPMRGGRIDATSAGPQGFVPQPQNDVGIFKNQFARLGMNGTAMIQMVSCGHTLGGVHASDNPSVIDAGVYPNDYAVLDTAPSAFDTKIASEFVSGTTKNPLVVGKSVGTKRNSDGRVYASDSNVTISAMQDAGTFSRVCQALFQQMIEVVPTGVTLTDVIAPYEVKPYDVQLTLLDGGSKLRLTGDIRVRTTKRTNIAQVQLTYKDRSGSTVQTPITTVLKGTASGFDDSFSFFSFSTDLAATSSISSFNVLVTSTGGSSQTFDNNGNGFKVDDTIIYQAPQSCLNSNGKLTVVAAVRSGGSSPNLQVVVKNPQASPNPVPSLSTATSAMATQSAVGSYQLYSADFTSGSLVSASFGVYAGGSSDTYKSTGNLPTACATLNPSPPTSTPTSSAFSFQGCYLDTQNPRALSSDSSADDAMTIEKCSTFCSKYKYFGAEYARECYCGNTISATSTIQALSDCNQPCGGNSNETCGAGSRLSLYQNLNYAPPGNPQISGYNYTGCYSEGTAGRALSDSGTNSDTMTVQSCAAFCSASTFFGVEYARECYCGNILNTGSGPEPATDCNMLCTGSSAQYCGAGNRLNIYQKLPVSSSSSTPSSTPLASSSISSFSSSVASSSSATNTTTIVATTVSTTSVVSTISASSSTFNASSSASSSSSVANPSTAVNTTTSTALLTSTTTAASSSVNLSIFSTSVSNLQNTTTVITVTSIANTSSTITVTSSSSSIIPSSNSASSNGSSIITSLGSSSILASSSNTAIFNNRSSSLVAQTTSSAVYTSNSTTLSSYSASLSNITGSSVASSTTSGSSSTIASKSSTPIPTLISSSTTANTTTASSQPLSSSMVSSSVVQSSAASSSFSPTVSPQSASSSATPSPTLPNPSSSIPSSSSAVPTPSGPSLANYTYVGCLSDSPSNRTLLTKSRATSDNTYAACSSFCSGYQYFGVEYASECYCSNALEYTIQNPSSDCSMSCSGDSSTPCGGPARITVFTSNTTVNVIGNPSIANYAYIGCYTDSVGARVLADGYLADSAMTIEKCAAQCSGYTYFGTEYGSECYCGNGWKNPSQKAAEGDCGFACGGNSLEYCGAGDRLTMYQRGA
ncbi:hypothetical protein P280DRAFT_213743 [Massarina eburnea CBS 473.64]|uniref:Heme peroxidase n=1 Tax=Massarina eburnea CBS 473.64 TaxID=1395130 RepID=A0A6A6S6Z4_9PLEO|nr:hypothetical protein P280DRAFT_213743 [Massarina eburnea CBS 473.64]